MNKNTDIIKATKQVVELIYQGKHLPLLRDDRNFILPAALRRDRRDKARMQAKAFGKIYHKDYGLAFRTETMAAVSGHYVVDKIPCSITLIWSASSSGIRIVHLHISHEDRGNEYQIKDLEGRQIRIYESDIFYLEAEHNHVLWYCREGMVETVGSLKEAENYLSEQFVRIHRGFIVNRKYVYRIARCYVELNNGEILQIPVKKYCEVKRALSSC